MLCQAFVILRSTDLVKVAHYGLPAAGGLCLSLLGNSYCVQQNESSRVRTIQDLGTLVAQIDAGGLVDPTDPNYALFAKAARAISNVLHRVITCNIGMQSNNVGQQAPRLDNSFGWTPRNISLNPYDLDLDFWFNLNEHPELAFLNNEAIIGVN